jgi:hypothetical protein
MSVTNAMRMNVTNIFLSESQKTLEERMTYEFDAQNMRYYVMWLEQDIEVLQKHILQQTQDVKRQTIQNDQMEQDVQILHNLVHILKPLRDQLQAVNDEYT